MLANRRAARPGAGDGFVGHCDFSCDLSLWSSSDAFADIPIDGTCIPGTAGDGVTPSDFSCYLALWSGGCDGDPSTPFSHANRRPADASAPRSPVPRWAPARPQAARGPLPLPPSGTLR